MTPATATERRMKLSVQDLNSHYGPAHILFDIALESATARWWRLLGAQRRRQIHHLSLHHRLVEQRTGRIVFEAGIFGSADPCDRARRPRYVPEERRIFTDLTVEEN